MNQIGLMFGLMFEPNKKGRYNMGFNDTMAKAEYGNRIKAIQEVLELVTQEHVSSLAQLTARLLEKKSYNTLFVMTNSPTLFVEFVREEAARQHFNN